MPRFPFPLIGAESDLVAALSAGRSDFAAPSSSGLTDLLPLKDQEEFRTNISKLSADHRIRGIFLRALLDKNAPGAPVAPAVLVLENLVLLGELDLRGMSLATDLAFKNCAFDDGILLTAATLPALRFENCVIAGVKSDGAAVRANASRIGADATFLKTTCFGELDVSGSNIDRSLIISGGNLICPGERAIHASGARIGANCELNGELAILGYVEFSTARIQGNLEFSNATIDQAPGISFAAMDIAIGLGAYFGGEYSCVIPGALQMRRASVGGNLVIGGRIGSSRAGAPASGVIDVCEARIGGDLELRPDIMCRGAIDCSNSSIDGTLRAGGVEFDVGWDGQTRRPSIRATNASIGAIDLAKRARSNDDQQSQFAMRAPGGIDLSEATVQGNVIATDAEIGEHEQGNVVATDAEIGEHKHRAVSAAGLDCRGNVDFARATIHGRVDLMDARIEGNLSFLDARLRTGRPQYEEGTREPAVIRLSRAAIKYELDLRFSAIEFAPAASGGAGTSDDRAPKNNSASSHCIVDLRFAHAGLLLDDEKSVAVDPIGCIRLGGFRYDRLHEDAPIDATSRNAWIRAEARYVEQHIPAPRVRRPPGDAPKSMPRPRFNPQPYEQLYRVLRAAGHGTEARRIAVAKNRDLRRWSEMSDLHRAWSLFIDATTGHWYCPWYAGVWIVGFLSLGFILTFLFRDHENLFVPTKELIVIQKNYVERRAQFAAGTRPDAEGPKRAIPPEYPDFNSFIYAIDAFVPIVRLKLSEYWQPDTDRRCTLPFEPRDHGLPWWRPATYACGMMFQWFLWVYTALGWLFSALFVVAMSGVVRRD